MTKLWVNVTLVSVNQLDKNNLAAFSDADVLFSGFLCLLLSLGALFCCLVALFCWPSPFICLFTVIRRLPIASEMMSHLLSVRTLYGREIPS